jgi:hypothetical protein
MFITDADRASGASDRKLDFVSIATSPRWRTSSWRCPLRDSPPREAVRCSLLAVRDDADVACADRCRYSTSKSMPLAFLRGLYQSGVDFSGGFTHGLHVQSALRAVTFISWLQTCAGAMKFTAGIFAGEQTVNSDGPGLLRELSMHFAGAHHRRPERTQSCRSSFVSPIRANGARGDWIGS